MVSSVARIDSFPKMKTNHPTRVANYLRIALGRLTGNHHVPSDRAPQHFVRRRGVRYREPMTARQLSHLRDRP